MEGGNYWQLLSSSSNNMIYVGFFAIHASFVLFEGKLIVVYLFI